MREERFYNSSIRGVLDAFQNSGFHITAPSPKEVFLKRIDFVIQLLGSDNPEIRARVPERIDRDVVKALFRILRDNFNDKGSHLANFLVACSHGNIRLALELFRGFLVSGYTNVREMTNGGRWTLQIHQVIKPFMVPSRFFYSEALSRVPNLFQIRYKSHGSHFTSLRILHLLQHGHEGKNPPFIPVAQLRLPFVDAFGMQQDFMQNMDVLLKHHLIEANNRLDLFNEHVDSVRITPYGRFMLNALVKDFTYLELVAVDTAISNMAVANEISEQSNDEYRFFINFRAMERVEIRLKRADVFIKYLSDEEGRERELYRQMAGTPFTTAIRESFEKERIGVLRSAHRNVPKKRYI